MLFLSLLALFYFLPTILAAHRGHGITGILLLNLFFGWTILGWFALLLWALLSRPPYLIVPVPTAYSPYPQWRRY
jgi:TM2 domain-containing membrane protein YozV